MAPTAKPKPKSHIKRPENAFILFRRSRCAELKKRLPPQCRRQPRQADLSKTISLDWKKLPVDERAYWEGLALEKRVEHGKTYPGYSYSPKKSGPRKVIETAVQGEVAEGEAEENRPVIMQNEAGGLQFGGVEVPGMEFGDDAPPLLEESVKNESTEQQPQLFNPPACTPSPPTAANTNVQTTTGFPFPVYQGMPPAQEDCFWGIDHLTGFPSPLA
ncbi:hypothetical protein DL96DRAFT_649082 [Flagelloscypha sp. PMI_526]|nr:hypothetical protein DL96DRAFT_649082 [Flagelloscypha sp. PMI_526]